MPREAVEEDSTEQTDTGLADLPEIGRGIVCEESEILLRVGARLDRESKVGPVAIENLDAQLIELRDAISEAKEEDVPSLIDQMHQVAALSRKRGQGRSVPIDPRSPYFGHLRTKEAYSGRQRDVLIGRQTLLDDGDGLSVVDWRNAPISRLYYRYEEDDEYDEEFDDRSMQGRILIRRSLAVTEGELCRIAAPQGTYARDRVGRWRETVGSARPTLQGGSGSAVRVPKGTLGVHGDDTMLRADKHLQEITALIDRQQFELITKPESGIVLIQGGAGSGKTTVALHRVAYLSFQDSRRFNPGKMLIVVFNDALVEYIRHVLPSLGVEGTAVQTYRRWAASILARSTIKISAQYSGSTPEAVTRFKKHPVILRMLDDLVAEQIADVDAQLEEKVVARPSGWEVRDAWASSSQLPPVIRADRMVKWLREGAGSRLAPKTRAAGESIFRAAKETLRDVMADFLELNTAGARIRTALETHAEGTFTESDIGTIVRWCARKVDLETGSDRDSSERGTSAEPLLDPEDVAILLRLLQIKHGGIFLGGKRFEYEHVVIDEAQDLCPLEVRVLLDCVSRGRSVTIAGDRAQKMIFDNGFIDWPQLLSDAGLPHVEIEPLKITYRSTRQVMEFSRHVLGPLAAEDEHVIARDGAEVSLFEFTDTGEAVAFLGEALRNLMRTEPSACVALVSRYPQQADVYYDALRIAEVPRLRRVRREDFSFTAGIDVTDVRQVKGLEFDYVILLDPTRQNYPNHIQSRHLMHIGATRAAYQLWLVSAGDRSSLLPPELVNEAV